MCELYTGLTHHGLIAKFICPSNACPGVPRENLINYTDTSPRLASRVRGLILLGLFRRRILGSIVPTHVVSNSVGIAWALCRAYESLDLVYVFHSSASVERAAEDKVVRGGVAIRERAAIYILKVIEQSVLKRARIIVVLSQFSKGLLVAEHGETLGKKVVVIPGGVDVESWRPRGAVGSRRGILTVRRMVWRMGLLELLDAFAMVEKEVDEDLIIVGDGPLRREIEDRIEKLGLDGRVVLRGRVSDEELRHIYQSARFFVLPTTHLEGFGLATVESMAAGCIPIGTDIGATPEIIGQVDPGLIVSAASSDIARALKEITSRGEEWTHRVSGRAQAVAKLYDWRIVIDGLIRAMGPEF
jgi:glycosyltransferase involved in cell wall biosynthesis